MRLKVLLHDNCFDGAASAALFARFYGDAVERSCEVAFEGLHHTQGDAFPPGCFDGDVNACVDFRYSRHPRLGWWFDHHASAFSTSEERLHYEASGGPIARRYYDPLARSCTTLMAQVLSEVHGFDPTPLAELVRWADVIDGALFDSAAQASSLEEPALQIAAWLEASRDPAARRALVAKLMRAPLGEVAARPEVQPVVQTIAGRQAEHRALLARRGHQDGDVVVYDLADDSVFFHGKFLIYDLFPTCRYVVGLMRIGGQLKISVGANPWAPWPRTHDIASLCERHGGGGHAFVGGVSLPGEALAKARAVVAEIAAALGREP